MIRVWDLWVRIGHWLLVLGIAGAWLSRHGAEFWHSVAGYGVLGLLAIRVAWGFCGSVHARFGDFVRSPGAVIAYTQALRRHRAPHYLGHNPLGGYMVLALLALIALAGASGWLYTTDRFWGVAWVGELHSAAADVLLGLVAAHVAGVLFASYNERENLIAAMLHGRKQSRG